MLHCFIFLEMFGSNLNVRIYFYKCILDITYDFICLYNNSNCIYINIELLMLCSFKVK